MPLQCMHVRIGYDTPCEMSSTFLRAWIVLGMMISLYVVIEACSEIRGKLTSALGQDTSFVKSYPIDVDKVLSESK